MVNFALSQMIAVLQPLWPGAPHWLWVLIFSVCIVLLVWPFRRAIANALRGHSEMIMGIILLICGCIVGVIGLSLIAKGDQPRMNDMAKKPAQFQARVAAVPEQQASVKFPAVTDQEAREFIIALKPQAKVHERAIEASEALIHQYVEVVFTSPESLTNPGNPDGPKQIEELINRNLADRDEKLARLQNVLFALAGARQRNKERDLAIYFEQLPGEPDVQARLSEYRTAIQVMKGNRAYLSVINPAQIRLAQSLKPFKEQSEERRLQIDSRVDDLRKYLSQ